MKRAFMNRVTFILSNVASRSMPSVSDFYKNLRFYIH